MAIISFIELVNILIATLVVGYIFTGIYPIKTKEDDVVKLYSKKFNWAEFLFSCLIAAPGIILHEMGHKFVAMAFGLHAFFQLSYVGLLLGVLLKLFGSGFLFLAPGYVVISNASVFQSALTSFAGPFVNLLLWLTGFLVLRSSFRMSRKQAIFWNITKEVNKWLFIFNMIPIPPLDGSKVLSGLLGLS